jgi:hypothetical protein
MPAPYLPAGNLNTQGALVAQQRAAAARLDAWFRARRANVTGYHAGIWTKGYFVYLCMFTTTDALCRVRYVPAASRAPWGNDADWATQEHALTAAAVKLVADGWTVTYVPNTPPHLLVLAGPIEEVSADHQTHEPKP